jgi:hypothetical protein
VPTRQSPSLLRQIPFPSMIQYCHFIRPFTFSTNQDM